MAEQQTENPEMETQPEPTTADEVAANEPVSDANVNVKPSEEDESKQPVASSELKKIVVAGATGGVGRHCVHALVRDPRVGRVYALARGDPKEAAFYGLDEKSDDMDKLQHLKVDYNRDLDPQFEFLTFDAGVSCVGVYTSDVKDEADFMAKEHAPNLSVANAAAKHGAKRWAYLSGAGVKQPEVYVDAEDESKVLSVQDKKGWAQQLFGWVKGKIEADLCAVFPFVFIARPGYILGKPGMITSGGISGWMEKKANQHGDFLEKKGLGVHRDFISESLVYAILNEELALSKPTSAAANEKKKKQRVLQPQAGLIYDSKELVEAAKIYRAWLSERGVATKEDDTAKENVSEAVEDTEPKSQEQQQAEQADKEEAVAQE